MAKGGFPGGFNMGGGGNMQQLIRQAQKLQQDMAKLQEDLGHRTVSASAGGGMVTATASGSKRITSITIRKDVIDPDDPEILQDLVTAAVNAALDAAEKMATDEMGKLTGGAVPPGMF